VVVWLASRQSSHVTARVIEAGAGELSITEGWRPGPVAAQAADPKEVGAILTGLVRGAKPNVGMNGQPAEI
jgi:hypothetical protein